MKRLALLSLCLLIVTQSANAQWVHNGEPVTTAPYDENAYRVIADGAGGMITVWVDTRTDGNASNIYAQKLDAYGVPKWTIDGLPVCTATGSQELPQLCSDGAGGAIITWSDGRSGSSSDVYAQRITAAGAAQWAANGVVIANATLDQFNPCITSDGAGGAIIAWEDVRNGNDDMYAQRINGSGVVQWAANGKSVCVVAGLQQLPSIVSDGANGAIVAWHDFRNGNYDIYAQRMSSAGGPQWTAGGVGVCIQPGQQTEIFMAMDGAGGALLTWTDNRAGNQDIYAQRINASGAAVWTANGVALCVEPSDQYTEGITTDGAGGAIVAWDDTRVSLSDENIYARRVSANGFAQWQANGVPVCTQPDAQFNSTLDSDGAGGAVLAWSDHRSGISFDVYAQRIDGNGLMLWDPDGDAVNDRPEEAQNPQIVWSGGAAIMAFGDNRIDGSDDIFAQRVDGRFSQWGHPEPTVTSVADVPSDQGGHVKVNWKASGQDVLGFDQVNPITYYTVWRATDAASAVSNGSTLVIDDLSKAPADSHKRTVYVQHAAAADFYWELAGTQSALKIPAYSMSVETRADSVAGNANTHHFMVAAQAPNGYLHWPSNEMSGRSIDNLSPPAPLLLTAWRAGSSVVLKWNRVRVPDLHNYSIYRQTSSGVTAIDPNLLDSTTDSTLVDPNAPASAAYYIVTASDVHANRSAASNEAAVSPSTGVSNMPPITSLMVMQNRPNPFGGRATFDIGLPKASRVELEVYDVAGRRVAARSLGTKAAGWQHIAIEAKDDAGRLLPSGVYFYRIHAVGETLTRKMVVAR